MRGQEGGERGPADEDLWLHLTGLTVVPPQVCPLTVILNQQNLRDGTVYRNRIWQCLKNRFKIRILYYRPLKAGFFLLKTGFHTF